MGDVAFRAVVNDLYQRLVSKVIKELALLWGLEDNISNLKNDFDQIKSDLEDAEETPMIIKEKAQELCLKRLRSALLMIENLLQDISAEALLCRLYKERGIIDRVRTLFCCKHNQLMFRFRIVHRIKAIRRKLEDIDYKRSFNTPRKTTHIDMGFESHMPDRETSSRMHDSSIIFGRNEEAAMVIDKICDKDIQKYYFGKILVYGIWGMGGVGKTTLAQLVYNDERVNKYFDFKFWVYVSKKFQVKEIIKKIIELICNKENDGAHTQLEMLQEFLRSKLTGKMFLIVLDDVWIEDDEKTKWDELREILSCGKEGSIVVITTRSQVTTRMVTTFSNLQHELGFLSKDDSWLLFKHFAFAEGRVNGGDISELGPIGREIVEKCKGLPLAIKTLGSSMWSKTSASEWERVKRNTIWEENNILPALKLSYDNLVPYLKRCFAYCGLFPKGYKIEKDDMIQLWIVNSFVPPRGGVVKKNRFYMHDLMHEMARHVSSDNYMSIVPGMDDVIIPDEALHLGSSFTEFQFSTQDLGKPTSLSLRILSWFPVCDDHICGAKIEELGNLNLIEGELEKLGPENVKGGLSEAKSANLSCKRNLVHLGLKGSHTKMFDNDKQVLEGLEPNQLLKVIKMMLMDSLKCFHDEKEEIMFLCLQELDISMCENLVFLPKNIPKLKILKISSCDKLVSLACSFPNLEVLKVSKCKELGSLPDNLLKLKNLYLNGCNKILSAERHPNFQGSEGTSNIGM
ncbi:hypothetical protein E3N88_09363 [Mikania micrantha]|uniref:NB-ARC domain-containing protein n=1 Tax=Mikania micrantha TaxID=192012 RepID=A0A5N6PJQ6_9ASTR|nr:hypothetical protein E3N88_09363 [Mikania micrantha]